MVDFDETRGPDTAHQHLLRSLTHTGQWLNGWMLSFHSEGHWFKSPGSAEFLFFFSALQTAAAKIGLTKNVK
jgi:hypothetical protein